MARGRNGAVNVRIKRAYAPIDDEDGYRVLIDGLWPRGISKERLRADAWMRELAPSDELRKWFGHEPSRWAEFQKRYRKELATKGDLLGELCERAKVGKLTLLYAAKDEEHNNAVVVRELLARRLERKPATKTRRARPTKERTLEHGGI